jgi:dienelactone hydrolase
MSQRNYLMTDWVEQHLAERGNVGCQALTPDEFSTWRKSFRARLRKALGPFPESVPLNPEILETTDCGDYIREKVVFDSERHMSVPAWVLVPKRLKRKAPAILCAHGHGTGKNPLVGLDADEAPLHEDYQHQMAIKFTQRGYVTIAPDWRGFGERSEDEDYGGKWRDPCNLRHMAAGYFGYNLLALQIHDGMRCIDYLTSRPEVNKSRIGCIGVSFGGTMTTYMTALDRRVKVGVISCYLSTIGNGLRRTNYCGAQYMPELAVIGDIADVALLAAPKPLLAEVATQDTCFEVDDASEALNHIRTGYKAAGVPERFDVDVFEGVHEFSGNKAFDWFDAWL